MGDSFIRQRLRELIKKNTMNQAQELMALKLYATITPPSKYKKKKGTKPLPAPPEVPEPDDNKNEDRAAFIELLNGK